jgi:hypothetical protein
VTSDVTVIVNCASEGRLVYPAIKSVEAAIKHAELHGITVEFLIAMNSPSDDLKTYLKEHPPFQARIMELEIQHMGAVRNKSIATASSTWVALTDGAHIWSENWITAALEYLQKFPRKAVAHSEVKIFFEKESFYSRNIDQESREFAIESLFEHNYWNASVFAEKKLFLEHPFAEEDIEQRKEFIDWHWSCETVHAGVLHKVVPETIHGIRLDSWKTAVPTIPDIKNSGTIASSLFDMHYKTCGSTR